MIESEYKIAIQQFNPVTTPESLSFVCPMLIQRGAGSM